VNVVHAARDRQLQPEKNKEAARKARFLQTFLKGDEL
jgi:hypothetical protein